MQKLKRKFLAKLAAKNRTIVNLTEEVAKIKKKNYLRKQKKLRYQNIKVYRNI